MSYRHFKFYGESDSIKALRKETLVEFKYYILKDSTPLRKSLWKNIKILLNLSSSILDLKKSVDFTQKVDQLTS